jgi:N-acetylglucosamine-6-phosphate deacetylase
VNRPSSTLGLYPTKIASNRFITSPHGIGCRGAQTVTHIANGMGNTINRHSNPLWSQLSDDRLMISMIADGFHLLS